MDDNTKPIFSKVTYAPVEQILIHQIDRLEVKDLVITRSTPANPHPRLLWCDEILFAPLYPADAKFYDEKLDKGILVFDHVYYAKMQKYEPIISIDSEEFGGIKANVDNVSWSKTYKTLISWLKSYDKSLKEK